MTIERRAAFVVGAASGMGRAVAHRFAADGFLVGLADVNADALAVVAGEIAASGGECCHVRIDVADRSSVTAGVEELRSTLGPPWVLAASAGIARGRAALDLPYGVLDEVMQVNFEGVAHVDVAVAREMVAAGRGGRIINWSSISAVGGTTGGSTYAASKAALDAFSKCLAVELGPYGITVNTIRPGSVDTPMLGALGDVERASATARIALSRFGAPADIAGAVAFLASDDAAWLTGIALVVDGGELAQAGRPTLAENQARFAREDATRDQRAT